MTAVLSRPQPTRSEITRARRSAHRQIGRRHGALIVSLLLVTVVQALNIAGYPRFFDDEGTYYSQAAAVSNGELAPYTYWYDHPPFGWIQLAPLVSIADAILRPDSVITAGRAVMVLYAGATAALVYGVAIRLGMRRPAATAAVLLWGLSPLTILMSRQLFLDNVGLPWLLASLLLVLNRRRDIFLHVVAGAALAVAVMSKETLLLAAPGVLWALLQKADPRTRLFSVVGFFVPAVLTVLAYPLLAVTRRELMSGPDHVSLWDGVLFQLLSRDGSGSPFSESSAANDIISGWLQADLLLPVAGISAALVTLLVRRLRPVGIITAVSVVVGMRPGGYLPAMFIVALLPFAALAAAGVMEVVLRALRRKTSSWVAGTSIALLVVAIAWAWSPGWTRVVTVQQNEDYLEALAWVKANTAPDDVMITDSVLWVDLSAAGRPDDGWSGAVWFQKYDLDSESLLYLPDRAEDVDYIISTPGMRSGMGPDQVGVAEMLEHSVVEATFGHGSDQIQVRRVGAVPSG